MVPRKCIADPELRLFQYTAMDEFSRLRFLAAYPEQSTYSSADFLKKLVKWYARRGIHVECIQTDNGFEFTNRFSNSQRDLPTLFEATAAILAFATSEYVLIRPATTAKWSAAIGRTRSVSIPATAFTLWTTLPNSLLSITAAPTTSL